MKVLHFFKTYFPETMGGIEQVIFQLAEGGVRHGIDTQVLYLSKRGAAHSEVFAHHTVHRAYENIQIASTGFSLGAISAFKQLSKQVDIVHYHFPWPFMDLVHFASGVKVPTVVSYHSDIVKQERLLKLYSPLMSAFLNSVDSIVASSPNYLETSSVLNRFKNKVSVIPIGIDSTTYPVADETRVATWRALLGERFFLFVGALRYYKGLDYLLDAAKITGIPVVILGCGPLEQELKDKCDREHIINVKFLGGLPDEDKAALLQLCYGLIFPSHLRSEAFGVTLVEGAMYGKPLISCEIGTGTTYININEETGLVVPPRDVGALVGAMRRLWDAPVLAAKLGEGAQERYQQLFRADTMVDSYLELYNQLISKRLKS
ncbi:glycosyltransferase family 4 protein [Pseudomonas lini]|uniref:Glycosyltransferase n=1 Tax=Pseudomonas lini TaxID=163011 RepID=A0A0J6HDQ7_9PSED|nr:glycosyltransferase family 4 protein [Pseudomonas lini]KAB0508739.1 glycosyltransferase [Pseudomonas lini]KMM92633.1 glycosyl transferase family 1 [Pseudomonas lini]SDS95261.1 rhamnosyl/mannosyltransferase [Pseudomonas lini]